MSNQRLVDWIRDLLDSLPSTKGIVECATPGEIRSIYCEWIEKLSSAIAEHSSTITTVEAGSLLGIVNSVLDAIESACDDKRLDPTEILGLLYPLEDVLVGLRLYQLRSKDSLTGAGYE
jgi:hypothetical protein